MFDFLPVLEELYQFLLAGHQNLTPRDYLTFALAGLVGALIYTLAFNEEAFLPSKTNGTVKLGVLGDILLGVLCGIAAGRGIAASILAGFLGPLFVPTLVKSIKRMIDMYQQRKREENEDVEFVTNRRDRDHR